MFLLYGTVMILSHTLLTSGVWKLSLFYSVLWGILYLSARFFILRESKSALKELREMPENTAEVNTPVLAVVDPGKAA
jgi:hypothetical protein